MTIVRQFFVFILFVALVSGCAMPPKRIAQTSSGRPEVMINTTDLDLVKSEIINQMQSGNFFLQDDSKYRLLFTRELEGYVPLCIPFYRSKEVIEKHNGKAISTELHLSIEKYNYIKEKFGVPEEGDMLLTSVGTLGIPYIVQKDEKFYFKDGNLTWFRNCQVNPLDGRREAPPSKRMESAAMAWREASTPSTGYAEIGN